MQSLIAKCDELGDDCRWPLEVSDLSYGRLHQHAMSSSHLDIYNCVSYSIVLFANRGLTIVC